MKSNPTDLFSNIYCDMGRIMYKSVVAYNQFIKWIGGKTGQSGPSQETCQCIFQFTFIFNSLVHDLVLSNYVSIMPWKVNSFLYFLTVWMKYRWDFFIILICIFSVHKEFYKREIILFPYYTYFKTTYLYSMYEMQVHIHPRLDLVNLDLVKHLI